MKIDQEYSIGEVVRRLWQAGFAISEHSLRVYERRGLLKPVSRKSARFRRYSEADVQRLISILKDLALGFEMADIQKLEPEAKRVSALRAQLSRGEIKRDEKEKIKALLEGLDFAKKSRMTFNKVLMAARDREKFFAELSKDINDAEEFLLKLRG